MLVLAPALGPSPITARAFAQGAAPAAPRHEPFVTKRDVAVAGAFFAASALLSLGDVEADVRRRAVAGEPPDAVRREPADREVRLLEVVELAHAVAEERALLHAAVLEGAVDLLVGEAEQRRRGDEGAHDRDVALRDEGLVVLRGRGRGALRERARPTTNGGTDQYDFQFFKGFNEFDYRAYPSIHSSSGFAAATVVAHEVAERWPRQKGWVGPVAYGLALTPGLSRMYLGQHWASDILMGAAIGVIAGQRIVTYNHRNPNNGVNRFFLGKSPPAQEPTVRVGFQRTF